MENEIHDVEQATHETQQAQDKGCQQELTETKNRLLSLAAEFQNYRKRTDQERIQWMNVAQQKVLVDVLPLVDDFDRAFEQLSPEQRQAHQAWLQGFELIYKTAQKLLHTYDIKEMPFDKEFDPEKHEALMHVASPEHASGQIVAVLQKGYLHKGAILRPAKVSVAQ